MTYPNPNPNPQSRSPNESDRSQDPRGQQSFGQAGRQGAGGAQGSEPAIECLASALEIVIRELPRGAAAKLDAAQEEVRKARQQLGSRGSRDDSQQRPGGASPSSQSARSGGSRDVGSMRLDDGTDAEDRETSGRNDGSDRDGTGRDDTSGRNPRSR